MKSKRIIHKLAIPNRGEIAVRIIQACDEMGIESVLLHSEVDQKSRAYRMATRKICLGPAPLSQSYLNTKKIIEATLASGAQALHPGVGFLSENSDFSELCKNEGLIFIGPSPEAMSLLGNKIKCKELAKSLGLPLLPGFYDSSNEKLLFEEAMKIGFPLIVKAAQGGGGRGLKLIRKPDECKEMIEAAQREALSTFGCGDVYLEKYLEKGKHIEIQIFGDNDGLVVPLYERDCSVQRRHQKIIEEGPAPLLSELMRKKLFTYASELCQLVQYRGAGTVEFLVQDDQAYLLEVNTRLQVEHPITEMIMGVDLVKSQILQAQGEIIFPVNERGEKQIPQVRGHAIECRICAENPFQEGLPSFGWLGKQYWPDGPGRRFDYGFEEGDEITIYYDSMIAKIIVWDENRSRCLKKMKKVLSESVIFGLHTNIPYLMAILDHDDFKKGIANTQFINKHFSESLKPIELTLEEKKLTEELIHQLKPAFNQRKLSSFDMESPFRTHWRGV